MPKKKHGNKHEVVFHQPATNPVSLSLVMTTMTPSLTSPSTSITTFASSTTFTTSSTPASTAASSPLSIYRSTCCVTTTSSSSATTTTTTTTATTTTTTLVTTNTNLSPSSTYSSAATEHFHQCLPWWLPFCEAETVVSATRVSKAFAQACHNAPIYDFSWRLSMDKILLLQDRFRGQRLVLDSELEVTCDFLSQLHIPSLREFIMLNCASLTDESVSHLSNLSQLRHIGFSSCNLFTQKSLDTVHEVYPELKSLGLREFSRNLNLSKFAHLEELVIGGQYAHELFHTLSPSAPLNALSFYSAYSVGGSLYSLKNFVSSLTSLYVMGAHELDTEWIKNISASSILTSLHMSDMKTISVSDFQLPHCHLHKFTIRYTRAENCTQILKNVHMDQLRVLELPCEKPNLARLVEAPKLEKLDVCSLADFALIAGCKNLRHLRINGLGCSCVTQSSFEHLSLLENLETIELKNCALINSLDPLVKLTKLKCVMISGLRNLSSLEGLPPCVQQLYLGGLCKITDVSPLSSLTDLYTLSLDEIIMLRFIDIFPLRVLHKLESLTLAGFGQKALIPELKILSETDIKQMNEAVVNAAIKARNLTLIAQTLKPRIGLLASEKERWNKMSVEQRATYRKWMNMSQEDKVKLQEESKISWKFLSNFPKLQYLWVGSPGLDQPTLQDLALFVFQSCLKQVMIQVWEDEPHLEESDLPKLPEGCKCRMGIDQLDRKYVDNLPIYD